MKLTVYTPFGYGYGEVGPYGNQTALIAGYEVDSAKDAANIIGHMCNVPDVLLIRQRKHEGVPVPKGALVVVADDDTYCLPFGILEGVE